MATKTKKRPAKPLLAPGDANFMIPAAIVELDMHGNEIQGMEDASVSFEIVINNELPKTFDEAVERIKQLEVTTVITKLLSSWEQGRIVEAAGAGKYGEYAVKTVAEASNIDKRTLQEYLRCYRAYPKIEDVKTLGLEWSSVREIMRLPNDTDRTRVAKTAQKESFTVREVRTAVNDIKAKEEPKKPKTPKKPPSAVTYFEKLDAAILTSMQNIRIVLEKKADMLKIAGDEELTPEEDFIRLTKIFKRCKQSTERLSAFLAREVVPLEKVFDATPKAAQSGKAKKSKK